jgi:hypothetical protein
MVTLGLANTRMKDFYDLSVIARRTALDGATLGAAIGATFQRRATALATEPPVALTRAFSEDASKSRQWQAFLNKNRIASSRLADTVELLEQLLGNATEVALGKAIPKKWKPALTRWE